MLVDTHLPPGKMTVRLINPNQSREETLGEIISALDSLGQVSNSVFSALKARLESQRAYLASLDKRVNTVADKVQQVTSKAIRIISTSKYPTELEDHSLKPILLLPPGTDEEEEEDEAGLLPPRRSTLPSRFDPPVQHPDELLACFHVREVKLNPLSVSLAQPGLGPPPPELKNLDSFLLFNTAENPYEHYRLPGKVTLINSGQRGLRKDLFLLKDSPKTPDVGEDEGTGTSTTTTSALDDFYYSPSMMTIPDMDVPDQLPDLPGIVDSLDFGPMDGGSGEDLFFPFKTSSRGDVPKLGGVEAPKPTPPPPLLPDNSFSSPFPLAQASLPATTPKSTPVSAGNPAPPPPPPPTAAVMPPILPSQTSSSQGGVNLRSSLMEAIRSAGGAGVLRSAQERKYETKKKRREEQAVSGGLEGGAQGGNTKSSSSTGPTPSSSSSAGGGDLMADLKNSLAMRRKGISGIREGPGKHSGGVGQRQTHSSSSSSTVGDIMQRLASTIPPMEKSNSTEEDEVDNNDSSSAEENDDWD